MSVRTPFMLVSGRLIRTPTSGFWACGNLGTLDPQIPYLELKAAAGAGGATLTADLAATEAPDTAAASATLVHVATLAATDVADVAAFGSTLKHPASLAATDVVDVAAFSATILQTHTADLAATDSPDIAAFGGALVHTADLAPLEQQDVAAFDGSAVHPADLGVTDAEDIAAFDAGVAGEETEEVEAPPLGGKGDNDGASKRRQGTIWKPTGLPPIREIAAPQARRAGTALPLEATPQGQAVAATDQAAASAFVDDLKSAHFAQTPIAQMSLAEIEQEIGILLKNKLRAEEEEDALFMTFLAAVVA